MALKLINELIDVMELLKEVKPNPYQDTKRSMTVFGYIRSEIENKYNLKCGSINDDVKIECCKFYGKYVENLLGITNVLNIQHKYDKISVYLDSKPNSNNGWALGFGTTMINLKNDTMYEWIFEIGNLNDSIIIGIWDKIEDRACLWFQDNGRILSNSENKTVGFEIFEEGDICKMHLHLINQADSFLKIYHNDAKWSGKVFSNDLDRKDQTKQYCIFFKLCRKGDYFSLLI
eukprot:245488_1